MSGIVPENYDAIVIGSGVGGMCAATLLANDGWHVLMAEKRRYLGGRFSTVNHDGYLCATGGLAVPVGQNLEQVCQAVGIPSGVKPSTKVALWLEGEYFDLSKGGTRSIIKQLAQDEEEAEVEAKEKSEANEEEEDEEDEREAWFTLTLYARKNPEDADAPPELTGGVMINGDDPTEKTIFRDHPDL